MRGGLFDFDSWRYWSDATEEERLSQLAWQRDLPGAVDIGDNCFVSPLAAVFCDRLEMGERSYIAAHAYVTGEVVTGAHCTINPYAVVRGRVTLGEGVRIGAHASIIASNHGFDDPHTPIFQQQGTVKGITFGDDVWVGSGAIIVDGVHVGSHCVLAAGAVVTRDVADYAVVGGNPARLIRDRLANHRNGAGLPGAPLAEQLEAFGRKARDQWCDVLHHFVGANEDGPCYLQQPGHSPTVRAWCDASEIAAMFGGRPDLLSSPDLIALLRGFQDTTTGMIPDPWNPPLTPEGLWALNDDTAIYNILTVGYALELLGASLNHPIQAIEEFSPDQLYERLETLPWSTRAWYAGAWVDAYSTGLYVNAKHFGSTNGPKPLLSWLAARVDRSRGLWGEPGADGDWQQPVNGFYRLTRGTHAQFGVPVPYPEATIDSLLDHGRDPRHFRSDRGNACNVLDVIHPLWLCGKQTDHRREEARDWAGQQLGRALEHWVDGQGFAFELEPGGEPDSQPSLQGTEMWLSIIYLLAELRRESAPLGYTPLGVHRLDPAWRLSPDT